MGFFEKELMELKKELIQMGRTVELNTEAAAEALLKGRADEAREVIHRDHKVNAMDNMITGRAVLLLATRQPVAGDLRFLTAALRLSAELERVGDQAANLGRRTLGLSALSEAPPLPDDIKHMVSTVRSMLEMALDALVKGDAGLSEKVMALDDRVDDLNLKIKDEAIDIMSGDGRRVPWGLEVINAAAHLERLGDHATNVAEEVVFMVSGQNVRHQTHPGQLM